jgi:7-cyano-7-deazaguanine synthase
VEAFALPYGPDIWPLEIHSVDNSSQKAVVLLSGGLDSTTALYDAASRCTVVAALSFDYGSKHNARELPQAAWHAEQLKIPHSIISLPFIGAHFPSSLLQNGPEIPKGHYEESSMKQTVVPFRNGILLSIAAGFAESRGAQSLVIAAHAGDHSIYPDCREDFMQAMDSAVRKGTYAGISIDRPFIELDKAGIVLRASELGIALEKTWSCYVGGEVHCGECGTCVERREAFELAQIQDPTLYLSYSPLPPRPFVV